MRDRRLARQHAGNREEAGLQHRVGARAKTDLAGDLGGIDDEEAQALFDDLGLHRTRQAIPHIVRSIGAVQKENAAWRGDAQHVLAREKPELVTGDEAGLGDEIGSLDRVRAETQVRDRLGARLVRIVDEISLGVVAGVFGDDLDAVLVGADRAIGAKAVEDGAGDVVALDGEGRVDCEAGVRDVVVDADGEAVARGEASLAVPLREFVERRLHHRRREILGRDAVAAADDPRHGGPHRPYRKPPPACVTTSR